MSLPETCVNFGKNLEPSHSHQLPQRPQMKNGNPRLLTTSQKIKTIFDSFSYNQGGRVSLIFLVEDRQRNFNFSFRKIESGFQMKERYIEIKE